MLILLVIVAVVLLLAIGMYNSLVRLKVQCDNAWADIYVQLQGTLSQLEDTLQNARRYYNAVVRDLNTKIAQFPSNILAGMFNFKAREFFEVTVPAEREVPKVSFGAAAQ